MATLAELIVKVGADMTQFEKHMGKVEGALNRTGSKLQDIGGKLTTGLTLPLAAVGGGALAASIDFESAFAGVRKTVDATDEELANMRQGILDMAKELPASATELSAIAEAAGQLGIKTENIMGFTRTIADLGVSTNLAGEEAATMLARFANITQMDQGSFDRLGATIVALGNAGASTEAEIMEMGLRIAGAGAQVGMTEPQILAIANALSSVGIEAEAGGSAISRVMINIAQEVASGGEKLGLFAQVAGVSSSEFSQAWRDDAAGALATFIEGLGRMSESGENVFGVLDELGLSEIRVRDALLRAAGANDLFRSSLETGSTAWEQNTALTNEAAQRYATTESKLIALKNQLVDVGITLGDALVPALSSAMEAAKPFIDGIANLATWFANLGPGIQSVIVNVGLFLAALGPVLGVVGTVTKTFSGLFSTLKLVAGWFSATGTAGTAAAAGTTAAGAASGAAAGGVGLLGGALNLLLSPITLVIAAIAGLIAIGYLLYTNWDEISLWLQETWNRISTFASEIWTGLADWFSGMWESIKTGISTAWTAISDWFSEWWGTILLGIVTGGLGLLVMVIAANWNTIREGVITAWTTITETVTEWTQAAWDAIVNILTNLPQWFADMWGKGREWTAQGWTNLVSAVTDGVRNLKDGMIRGMEAAWDYLRALPGKLWEWGKGAIRGFVEGFLSISIPIPRFGIDWNEGPLGVKIPKLTFGIDWKELRSFVPFLADGGIVTAPTLAVIGEAGPEAVVPLSKMDRTGGGGQIIINWSSLARPSDSEVRQVAGMLNREIGRMMGARA